MIYRREIDGLRAIAVMSVIFFHAGFGWISGGYVGVDVFFVISGYLITTILLTEHQAQRFSLLAFYERRARRILPALFVVMAACLPLAWFWMVPHQLKDFAKSVLAVLTFSSNILFWRESGYFEASTELKPLLHTWSLAIEEQFYVVLPLVIMLVWRFGLRVLTVLVAVAGLLSLLLAEWAARKGIIVANFYLMPTRAWELLIGSAVAIYLLRRSAPSGTAANFGSALGLFLLLYSIFGFDRTTPFPSLLALVPTVGTALLILCAVPGSVAQRLLSAPIAVGIGLISYSAYLWHQPLFAFARLIAPEMVHSRAVFGSLIGATLLLGWLTWRYVERPFRDRSNCSRTQVFGWTSACTLALVGLAVPVVNADGVISRFPEKDRYLLSINPTELGRYTEKRFRKLERRGFDAAGGTLRVAIIGDSYAQDLVNMISENGYMKGAQIVTFALAARCPKYIGVADVPQLYAQSGERLDAEYCEQNSNLKDAIPLARAADVVMLAGRWRPWEAEKIRETLHAFALKPEQMLIVLGRKDFGTVSPMSYVRLTPAQRRDLRNVVPAENALTNAAFRRELPAENFVDLQATLCGNGAECRIFTPAGKLLTFDGEHFTPEGAVHAGQLVFGQPVLGRFK